MVPFSGGFPPPMQGAVSPWPGLMDNPKQWEYYPRRDKEREKERERDRQRERGHERDHSPTPVAYNRSKMMSTHLFTKQIYSVFQFERIELSLN